LREIAYSTTAPGLDAHAGHQDRVTHGRGGAIVTLLKSTEYSTEP
jgi:hypothetical protein